MESAHGVLKLGHPAQYKTASEQVATPRLQHRALKTCISRLSRCSLSEVADGAAPARAVARLPEEFSRPGPRFWFLLMDKRRIAADALSFPSPDAAALPPSLLAETDDDCGPTDLCGALLLEDAAAVDIGVTVAAALDKFSFESVRTCEMQRARDFRTRDSWTGRGTTRCHLHTAPICRASDRPTSPLGPPLRHPCP